MPSVCTNPSAPISSAHETVSLLKVSSFQKRRPFGSPTRLPMASDEWMEAQLTRNSRQPAPSPSPYAVVSLLSFFPYIKLHNVILANHDQNVLVLFKLAQSMWLYVKLESSRCRIYCVNLPISINRELDSINRKSCRLFFLQNFQLSPSTFDVQDFMFCPRCKRKKPQPHFRLLLMLCV